MVAREAGSLGLLPIMRLLLIIGPPAVGKMTVGREIAARSDFRLFHNHHTIEPLIEVFGYGTAPFNVLNSEFRRRVIEEAARNNVDLIFTFVWNLADPADTTYVKQLVAPFDAADGEIWVLELTADLDTRLVRNRGESRLAAKPTKRDLEWSDGNVRSMEAFQLNTDPTGSETTPADGFLSRHPFLRLDTRSLSAGKVAEIAIDWLEQEAEDTANEDSKSPPAVSVVDPPAGTEKLAVQWLRITDPDLGAMLAAVARPSGPGPFPVVVVLHGTHGFAQEYVQWAEDLARGGFLAVAACWFSGGSGGGSQVVTPIPCPEIPPLKRDSYPEAVQYISAIVKAARTLPGARADRLGIVGHSRGGGETLQYLLAIGDVQAAVLHSAGHGYRPVTRAAEFSVPILLLHGTVDGPADGGGVNTQVALARDFEAELRRNRKSIEAHYYEGGGHNTFFTDATQRGDELKKVIAFLRHHLDATIES